VYPKGKDWNSKSFVESAASESISDEFSVDIDFESNMDAETQSRGINVEACTLKARILTTYLD